MTSSIYADRAPSLYLGFDKVFPAEAMTLYFVVAPRGANAELAATQARSLPAQPSLRWEYFNGVAWIELSVLDRTMQFSQSGTVDVLIPADIGPLGKFDLEETYWIRAMLVQPSKNGDPFRSDPLMTPRLEAIFINTVPAVQALTISNEILGSGNALPGQRFRLTQSPVLAKPEIFVLEPELPSAVERDELEREQGSDAIQQRINPATEDIEIWIRWREVSDFNGSYPHSRHYTLDHGTGELAFGNGILGLVPPLGSNNIVANYRVSAGFAGNVAKATVVQLRSAVPGVASVTNRLDAEGGAGLETAEIARQRGPQMLRHSGRAVSRTDFEWLVREAAGTGVARVVCLPNINRAFKREPGWVTLVIIPQGTDRKLLPTVDLIQQVENSFRDRSFAGLSALNRVHVTGPDYIEVAVAVDAVVRDLRQAAQVKRQIAKALDRFLHPLTGGPTAEGWKLGRNVFASEIASVVHMVPGVDYLNSLQLIPSQAQHRIEFAFPWICPVDLPENTLIASRDGRKSALVAEAVSAGTELRSLTTKGFKVGDRLIQELDADVFNPPLTITAVTPDRDSATQVIGIESWDYDGPAAATLLSTPDHRIKLPVSTVGLESPAPALQFLTLEDFSEHEVVQFQPTKQGSELPTARNPASVACIRRLCWRNFSRVRRAASDHRQLIYHVVGCPFPFPLSTTGASTSWLKRRRLLFLNISRLGPTTTIRTPASRSWSCSPFWSRTRFIRSIAFPIDRWNISPACWGWHALQANPLKCYFGESARNWIPVSAPLLRMRSSNRFLCNQPGPKTKKSFEPKSFRSCIQRPVCSQQR